MKQIFDWLREQIEENSVMECYTNIISSNIARILVDEAEAKWEAECCEWKHHNKYEYAESGCGISLDTHRIGIAKFSACPYCGKKIKILEVE